VSILLIGRWCWGGDLHVTASRRIKDGDVNTVEALIAPLRADEWSGEYDVDTHDEAVRCAFEEYARGNDADLVDEVGRVESGTS